MFCEYLFNIFFESGDMSFYQSPKKFILHFFIRVNHPVACLHYRPCVWQSEIRITFEYAVNGFPHYLNRTFYGTNHKTVVGKNIKTIGIIGKELRHILTRQPYIFKIFQNIFIHI